MAKELLQMESSAPTYKPALTSILRAVMYITVGRQRSLARDAFLALRDVPTPPLIRGGGNIAESGPLVIVANHYERPRLWMAWPALFAGATVLLRTGREPNWVAIQEWESFRLWNVPIHPSLTRLVFERAFHVYGIIPMPPPHARAMARAQAMKAAVRVIRKGGIVGLMPEGTVGKTPELLPAREGVGIFLLSLAAAGARILPLGIYEEDERLLLQFGALFDLQLDSGLPRLDRDKKARDHVMSRIKALLPETMWGAYS